MSVWLDHDVHLWLTVWLDHDVDLWLSVWLDHDVHLWLTVWLDHDWLSVRFDRDVRSQRYRQKLKK